LFRAILKGTTFMQVQTTSTSVSYNQPGLMSSGAGFASGNHASTAFNQGRLQGTLDAAQALSGTGNFMSSGAGFAAGNNTAAAFNQGRLQGTLDATQALNGANPMASRAAGPQIFSPEEALQSGAPQNAGGQGAGNDGGAQSGGSQNAGGQKMDPAQIMQMVMGLLTPLMGMLSGGGGGGAGAAASGILGGLGGSASA
jgi:hypothetical protein